MLNKLTLSCEFIRIDRGIVKVDLSYPWKTLSFGKALRKHVNDGVDTYRVPGLAKTPKSTLLVIYAVRHIYRTISKSFIHSGRNSFQYRPLVTHDRLNRAILPVFSPS